jgi:hypothetical protein
MRSSPSIAVLASIIVACGGQATDRAGVGDNADSGTKDAGSRGAPAANHDGGSVGHSCNTDTDCVSTPSDVVCEVGHCQRTGDITYPTEPVPPVSTDFPTPCYAADLGLLELRLSPPPGRQYFGTAVALDETRLAVGWVDGVQIYDGDGSSWREGKRLELPESMTESVKALALQGNTVVVGSTQSGAAFVFDLGSDAGALAEKIEPGAPEPGVRFGESVALDGATLAIASPKEVAIYDRGSMTWSESQRLVPSTPVTPAGLAVALRGDLLSVAAYWFVSSAPSERSAVFVYRRTAGSFVLESRIDPGSATTSFATTPALGDGLMVLGSDPPTVYTNGSGGWTLEARLSASGATALDGSRVGVQTEQGVTLFDRAGGAWRSVQTITQHDVSATFNSDGPIALRGQVVVVGAPYNTGNRARAGAVYSYAPALPSSAPDCAGLTVGPPRIEGAGTGCLDPGTGVAACPFAEPGTSTVSGTTPYGAVAFPFAWTHEVNGATRASTLVVSAVAPQRAGSSPKLRFTLPTFSEPPVGRDIPVSFDLELCTRSVAVDGFVRLDASAIGPLVGSMSIQKDGWALTGSFSTKEICSSSTDT